MRSERSTQELLKSASKLHMMSENKQAEIWQKIEENMPKTEGSSPKKRLFSYSYGKAISVAVLSILTLCAVVLIVPRVSQTAAYKKSINNPIPRITEESFPGSGLKVTPLKYRTGDHFITENEVLKITDPPMKFWKGKTRQINLASVSMKVDSTFVHPKPMKTANDPHFKQTRGAWKQIPCYIVTINGATGTIPVLGTKSDPNPTQIPVKDTVIVDIVDATSGNILMEYQYGNGNGN